MSTKRWPQDAATKFIELCLHCFVLLCHLGDLSGLATQCQTSDIQNQSATSDCYWLNFIQGNNFSVEVRESFVDYSINMNLLYPLGSNAPAPLTPESQYEVFCYAQDDWSIQATCQKSFCTWKHLLSKTQSSSMVKFFDTLVYFDRTAKHSTSSFCFNVSSCDQVVRIWWSSFFTSQANSASLKSVNFVPQSNSNGVSFYDSDVFRPGLLASRTENLVIEKD